ncbi:MAG TPA: putative baseplate assembly protein [Bryobacteraceae bacterium]|jgi:hypothetical protein|nr:putative baseplate assembly protein [Bryobacteraceae bacterium]
MIYNCCNQNRKAAVLGNPAVNGIDYLEVLDHDAIPLNSERQRTLLLHCLKAAPAGLAPSNVLITGGESITGIETQWIAPASAPPPEATAAESAYFTGLPDAANTLVIRVDKAGDFSPYTLRLVNNATQALEGPFEITEALAGFDPELAEIEFSFKVECGPDFDCAPAPCNCPPDLPAPPAINYLAKDYGSFRTVMLDRMNQLLPNWGAASEADLGIALVELMAYVGDYLSYRQDAVATEAYLQTARSRVSLRRHALLVDYRVHDGSNARAWIQVQVSAEFTLHRADTRFYTSAPGMPANLKPGSGNEERALLAGVVAFEPMQDATLFPEHNKLTFYAWGDTNCCLPAGATEATLAGTLENLKPGDVLIFEEVIGPQTGNAADADLRHRCAVRLTQVATKDGRGQTLVDPLFEEGTGKPITSAAQQPAPVTEIQWSKDDALPFPVCLSSTYVDAKGETHNLTDVSVASGNVVLADQGLSFTDIALPPVPLPALFRPPNPAGDRCRPAAPTPLPVRYRPVVPEAPLTQAVPLPVATSPVTREIVRLPLSGYASLTDANGFVSLTIAAADPAAWPANFGVIASANAAHAGNFDLTIVYNPPGGPEGVAGPVAVESFSDLSINPADANYAPKRLNGHSRFLRVPAAYVPPATAPASFPPGPAMLPNTGTFDLKDSADNPYLTVEAANPLAWPASIGVLTQGSLADPGTFNLLVVYAPLSGGVGVLTPVLLEQFNGVTLDTAGSLFTSASELISVRSFSGEPNPALSAYALMHWGAADAVPAIELTGTLNGVTSQWTPQPDLLADGPTDKKFVVETESDGTARLRFGDGVNGFRPVSGTTFTASYRIGNGAAGNVGAESLVFFAGDPRIESCTNPLPATGGTDPETTDQIRRRAPQAFMTQERAVTMPDYVRVAEMNPQIENAVATLRWTGSWYTVFITGEPRGAGNLTPSLIKALRRNINRYRLAGQDIELESPEYVPLGITLAVCVDPDYFRSDVEEALLQVLGSGKSATGENGLFHRDNFTFGQTVYLSPIYAAARKVPGVLSVTATTFAPQGVRTPIYLSRGEIPLGPFQIARLDNDRSFPNHGQLTLTLEGGK